MEAPYPVTFFNAIQDSIAFIERCRSDDAIGKADALDGMETRTSIILKKMLAAPTATSYSFFRDDA